ncbi:TPA: hypothetical protein ACIK0Q_000605 [Campylobacter jejuni]|nr:hypothetical protein [Campylobacter jejuni]
MSRLLLNYELIKNDHPPINIKYSAQKYKNVTWFDNLISSKT